MNKCLIFWRERIVIGGVENYIYKLTKKALERDIDVVWIVRFNDIESSFSDVLGRITIISQDKLNSNLKLFLLKNHYETVYSVTFDWDKFSRIEKFKLNNSDIGINNYLFVSHFCGETLFPEELFHGDLKKNVSKCVRSSVKKLESVNAIRFFSRKHLQVYEHNYEYIADNLKEKFLFVPYVAEKTEFDENQRRRIYNDEIFNILTITRFDFPHKGYVIGLIDTFKKLSKSNPRLHLTIAGYGQDQDILIEKLNNLPEETRKKITLIGKVSPDECLQLYKKASLNIGLAGAFSTGARAGVLSLPVRHYTYSCETYGYLPESKGFALSTKDGVPIEEYILEILQMSEEEYITKCKESYYTYPFNYERVWDDLPLEDYGGKCILTKIEIKMFCLFYYLCRIKSRFSKWKTKK